MASFKRLATERDNLVRITSPLSPEEIIERKLDYPTMPALQFLQKHRQLLFVPVRFTYRGTTYQIRYNHCLNPFCKWYAIEQGARTTTSTRAMRYRLFGNSNDASLLCNPDPATRGVTFNCQSTPISNWSVAEEIKRLVKIGSVVELTPNYQFHKNDCPNEGQTPFITPAAFDLYGKSKTNSRRYKCKTCNKITNVLPQREEAFSYHQKRNEDLPTIAMDFISKQPITLASRLFQVSPPTYYRKLEYIYMRCLEFLERHETEAFAKKNFSKIWVDTDLFEYNLNNMRQKGAGGGKERDANFRRLQMFISVSAEVRSRYVFRADVAYDWDVTKAQIERDTELYKCDHMTKYERKNERLEYPYAPQIPNEYEDSAEIDKYAIDKEKFERRFNYVQGLRVSPQYTTLAHFWLLREMINTREWFFISDEDWSIMNSVFRVFSKEILDGYANYFLCKIDRSKSRSDAIKDYTASEKVLLDWRFDKDMPQEAYSDYRVALDMLTDTFTVQASTGQRLYQFYQYVQDSFGVNYLARARNPITHPLAAKDVGDRTVDVLTNLTGLDPKDIAKLILQVNKRATDSFMVKMRRRLSLLERPLVGARSDLRSYLYANHNPRYAQYFVTILRTHNNFCVPFKNKGKKLKLTPAQRLGIAGKVYNMNDIIYFK